MMRSIDQFVNVTWTIYKNLIVRGTKGQVKSQYVIFLFFFYVIETKERSDREWKWEREPVPICMKHIRISMKRYVV